MTKQEEIITVFPRYQIKTRNWKDLDGNIVVEWDGVLLVYPDLEASND